MADLFTDCLGQIEEAYTRLGHRLGWRFLATPRRTLNSGSRVAFITLNPGGNGIDPTHGVGSCEGGSAYVHESWKGYPPGQSPLQQQVQRMFQWLNCEPDNTLSAYFIPFRSPSYEELVAPYESHAFAVQLWRGIFAKARPALIVCIGNETEKGLLSVLGHAGTTTSFPVGWGAQTAALTRYGGTLLLRLPHLSRFGIFGRLPSNEPLRIIRAEITRVQAS